MLITFIISIVMMISAPIIAELRGNDMLGDGDYLGIIIFILGAIMFLPSGGYLIAAIK